MSVLAPASSIKRDRQIERGQTEWKGWPQNPFFCLVETWYAIKKLCSIWIQTVEYSQFHQPVLWKWDTLLLSDTRLYECFSWLICFVSTFQFQFGAKQTDIYVRILHSFCVIETLCELISEICNSAAEHNLQVLSMLREGEESLTPRLASGHHQTSHSSTLRQCGWSFEITVPSSD